MTDDRIISSDAAPGESHDRALRPQTLSEFVGQEQAKGNLKVFIDAARVVAPTRVKGARSMRTLRAEGPSPMIRSST